MFEDRLDRSADGVRGQGKADAAYDSGGVQPSRAPVGGDQRPAGEAGVHGRVRLDVSVDLAACAGAPGTAEGADDAGSRLERPAWPGDGHDQVATRRSSGLGPGDRG